MNNIFTGDWRKIAAQTAVHDADIEKAFSDQASGFVENKLGKLADPQYSIGFEIVRKNDENTRMVGIFAYKVEDKLLFAPVFFLNGEIKGPLLYRCDTKSFIPATKEWASYLIEAIEMEEGRGRDRTRRFQSAPLVQMQRLTFNPTREKMASMRTPINVPVYSCACVPTPDSNSKVVIETQHVLSLENWVDKTEKGDNAVKVIEEDDGTIRFVLKDKAHIMTKKQADAILHATEGQSVPIVIDDYASFTIAPEGVKQIKKAFFENIPNNLDKALDYMLEKIEHVNETDGTLKDFLSEPGYGEAACDFVIKAAETSKKFANALALTFGDPKNFIPDTFGQIEKKASAVEEKLSITFKLPDASASDEERDRYFQDGFLLVDTRNKGERSTVVRDADVSITTCKDPGVYSIVTSDGNMLNNVTVLPVNKDSIAPDCNPIVPDFTLNDYRNRQASYIAIQDGNVGVEKNIMGVKTGTIEQAENLTKDPEENKAYILYIGGLGYDSPLIIKSVKHVDGVSYISAIESRFSWDRTQPKKYVLIFTSKQLELIYNKNTPTSNLAMSVIGQDALFIELPKTRAIGFGNYNEDDAEMSIQAGLSKGLDVFKCPSLQTSLANETNLDNFIFNTWKMPKVSILKKVAGNKASYYFSDNFDASVGMSKMQAIVKLASDLSIHKDTVYNILDEVDRNGYCEFYLQPMEKSASRLHIVDRPQFEQHFDDVLGIPMEDVQEFNLNIMGDQQFEPPSTVGDAFNPTSLTGLPSAAVTSTEPSELQSLADSYHLPNIFEHGLVGTLADTFNALTLLDKYIPKLEDAVDSLGRIKFLLYWRPADFEKSYGSDEMLNLEAEIDSNFDSLGSILLKLLKKTERQRKGLTIDNFNGNAQ